MGASRMTVLMARMRGALAAIVGGIAGTLVGPTTINTSTAATATAYSNQRKVDRCQNGVLWAVRQYKDATLWGYAFLYSTDNGATWTDAGGGIAWGTLNYTPNSSFFIDVDDYAHHVYKNAADGYIYYRRGTPNAARTAWTWSAATLVNSDTGLNYPDIVAHREGTGWRAHIVASLVNGTTNSAFYWTVTVASDGGITVGAAVNIGASSYGTGIHTWPSIDFNHTGDGKTVAGGTPHLYVSWSAGAAGAGKGIRFRKAVYSAGAWNWNPEVEIDSTRHVPSATGGWLNCLFDGTRVVMGGTLTDAGNAADVVLYDRDAADATTTTRLLIDNSATTSVLAGGSLSYDSNGNVYLFGADRSGANGTRLVNWRKWTRSSATLGAITTFDSTGPDTPYISAKRGYSDSRIEFIYTDGTASPYNVVYGGIK